jgi:endonuclease/exonuclease/phosphatase family metal-dependent hydrolase
MIRTLRSLLPWLLLSLTLSAQGGAATFAQGDAGRFKIGTWNLEWLGLNERNGLAPRDAEDYQKIGDKVRSLGVVVLAVQEIGGEAPLRKVAAGAGPSWEVVLGTTGGIEGKPQNVGFLYDSREVELLQAEELLQLPREQEGLPVFNRVPVTACFRVRATGFDFRMITVHLKAGQKKQDEQKRRLEATTLHDWITSLQQTKGEDQDIVVLGDFNSTYGTEPEVALEKGGSLQYMHPAAPTPTIMHFPEPIDQVAVAPGFDELRRDSFTVHGDFGGLDKDAWRKTYSDHFPVTVSIVAGHDTDPDARFRPADAAQTLPVTKRPQTEVATTPTRATRTPDAAQPKVGTTVSVRCLSGLTATGVLLANLPDGPGGWMILAQGTERVAIPFPQVIQVTWH